MTAAIPATLISLTADIVLLTMMIVIALAVVFTRSLLASILLMSIYSLVAAIWFVMLDAPDVGDLVVQLRVWVPRKTTRLR